MSAGMWLGFYIVPSVVVVASMLWYAYIYGPKQDKHMEERRNKLIQERNRKKGADK